MIFKEDDKKKVGTIELKKWHWKDDHDKNTHACLYEICECTKFDTFQLNILKKKKVVTNIKFLSETNVKDDALAWNCLNRHKYSKTD